MLSGDLATLLTGHYVEISMLPLSFQEYMELGGQDRERVFADYIKYGACLLSRLWKRLTIRLTTILRGFTIQ